MGDALKTSSTKSSTSAKPSRRENALLLRAESLEILNAAHVTRIAKLTEQLAAAEIELGETKTKLAKEIAETTRLRNENRAMLGSLNHNDIRIKGAIAHLMSCEMSGDESGDDGLGFEIDEDDDGSEDA